MIASVPVLWWLEPGPEYEYKELHLKKPRVRTHSLYKTDFNHLLGTELCSHGLWYEREHCPDYGGYHFHWHLRKIPVFQKARLSGGFLRCNNANKTLLAKILCLPPFLWWQHPPHPCNRYFVVRESLCSAPQHFQVYQRRLDEWPLELTPQMVYDTQHCLLRNTLCGRVCCPSTAERVKSAWKLMDQKLFWI